MTIVDVAIIGLAAWRVAALLSYERGPFHIFERFRQAVATPVGDVVGVRLRARLELETALACVWCLSPWTAALAWLVYRSAPAVVVVLAASAIVVAVEQWARPS